MFITYDGLLDPLGASQILPYLTSIAAQQGGMVVLSFEKREPYAVGGARLADLLRELNIHWQPLLFTARLGIAGKLWDLLRMYAWGLAIARRRRVTVAHARGHPCAQVGQLIKRLTGARLIFDVRGLWVDERVDKGGWDLSRPLDRLQYRIFKRKERHMLALADHVVVLSDAVVPEVTRLGADASRITVIPCCADFEHFPLATHQRKAQARQRAGIPDAAAVLGYLGSIGRMYMLDRFFRFLELAQQHRPCFALVVTRDVEALQRHMALHLPAALHRLVVVASASRTEVPDLIPAMDVLVSFIQPSYARIATSPTKLAECFAEGIPAICNDGVGDVTKQMHQLQAGVVIDPHSDDALSGAAAQLGRVVSMGGARLREAARSMLDLAVAQARYRAVYSAIGLPAMTSREA